MSSSPRVLGVGPTFIRISIHPFIHPYHDTFIVIGGLRRHAIVRDPQETGDVAGDGGPHTPRLADLADLCLGTSRRRPLYFNLYSPHILPISWHRYKSRTRHFDCFLIVPKLVLAFSILTGALNSSLLASCHSLPCGGKFSVVGRLLATPLGFKDCITCSRIHFAFEF